MLHERSCVTTMSMGGTDRSNESQSSTPVRPSRLMAGVAACDEAGTSAASWVGLARARTGIPRTPCAPVLPPGTPATTVPVPTPCAVDFELLACCATAGARPALAEAEYCLALTFVTSAGPAEAAMAVPPPRCAATPSPAPAGAAEWGIIPGGTAPTRNTGAVEPVCGLVADNLGGYAAIAQYLPPALSEARCAARPQGNKGSLADVLT